MRHISYQENTIGIDYVCTDIHGCYDQLEYQLEHIGFNTSTDRLFVCGDLIDRGLHHDKITQYITQNWLIPILGNHEMFLLASTFDVEELSQYPTHEVEQFLNRNKKFWYENGGSWWDDIDPDKQSVIKKYIRSLPFIIDLTVKGKTVGLIHAQIDCDWKEIIERIKKIPEHPAFWLFNKNLQYADLYDLSFYLEGRQKMNQHIRFGIDFPNHVTDIDLVIHGHTIIHYDSPVYLSNCVYIDHGGYIKAGQLPQNIEHDPFGLKIYRIEDLLL